MSVVLAPATAASVRPYSATPMPSAFARQMMNRMSFGFCSRTFHQMQDDGGPNAWFARQLNPRAVWDPRGHDGDDWWPDRMLTANQKWKHVFADKKSAWEYAVDL